LEGLHWHHYKEWYQEHRADADRMLEYIRQNGAVRSADFERQDGKKGSWWDWKIEKNVLEHWFTAGELMITRREKFQRVYDLRERIRPDWDDARAPSWDETLRVLVLKTVRSLGLARRAWVADYLRLPKTRVPAVLKSLERDGLLLPVPVEGWEEPALACSDEVEKVEAAASGQLVPDYTALLSPFDALIWDRTRARQLFGFDFSIECYLPAPKRIYGYYLLPILHRGALVGRLDAKAHRQAGLFEVKALYLEDGVSLDAALAEGLASALRSCAAWHRTPQVAIRRCTPESFLPLLENSLFDN
jgi:uncharacterized protein YcaQ